MNIEQERAELLPCPFCGGEARISKQMGESLWSHHIVLWTQVQCDGCEAQVGPTCEGFEVEAIDIWNRRAALQEQDREDALRYRYLKYQFSVFSADIQGQHSWLWRGNPSRLIGPNIDEAIDHARRIEGEAK